MLSQIYVNIWRNYDTMSNELTHYSLWTPYDDIDIYN